MIWNGYLAQFWLLATRNTQPECFWQTYPSLKGLRREGHSSLLWRLCADTVLRTSIALHPLGDNLEGKSYN